MSDQKISLRYIFIVFVTVFFTWFIHEFAHWAMSEGLGYEATMRINSVSPADDQIRTDLHAQIISAAGPLVTLFQAIVVFVLLSVKGWNKYLYLFLFVPFYMRLLAGLMNFIQPNDEGRISEFLGLGLFTISILVTGVLLYLVYRISKQFRLSRKFHLWTTILVMIASSMLILGDQLLKINIL